MSRKKEKAKLIMRTQNNSKIEINLPKFCRNVKCSPGTRFYSQGQWQTTGSSNSMCQPFISEYVLTSPKPRQKPLKTESQHLYRTCDTISLGNTIPQNAEVAHKMFQLPNKRDARKFQFKVICHFMSDGDGIEVTELQLFRIRTCVDIRILMSIYSRGVSRGVMT